MFEMNEPVMKETLTTTLNTIQCMTTNPNQTELF